MKRNNNRPVRRRHIEPDPLKNAPTSVTPCQSTPATISSTASARTSLGSNPVLRIGTAHRDAAAVTNDAAETHMAR